MGYLLYPVNLFVWTWMLRRSDEPAVPGSGPPAGSRPVAVGAGRQLSSFSSNSSIENGVTPAGVVGGTTTPASQ